MLEKLEEIRRKYEEVRARLADPEFVQDHRAVRDAQKTLSEFEPVVTKTEEYRRVQRELQGAREMTESLPPGDELYQLASSERAAVTAKIQDPFRGHPQHTRPSHGPAWPPTTRQQMTSSGLGTGR